MRQINSEEFNEVLKDKVVLVDFSASWCGPCKMLAPVLESVSETMKDKVTIVKVDVDESMDLASQFGIMAVPTMVLFKDGKQVDAFSGYMPEATLISNIERNL